MKDAKYSRRHVLRAGAAGWCAATTPSLVLAASKRSQLEQVWAALDEPALIQLALEFSDIPSPLGREEYAAQFFRDRLGAAGLTAELQSFAPGRANAIGELAGSGAGKTLLFSGHLETGGSLEPDPFPKARIDGEWLSGVGIWNMKGAMAAYLAAAAAVRKARVRLRGTVKIAATAGAWDEAPVESGMKGQAIEGYGVGIKHWLTHGARADMAVVGEPTSLKLVRRHFGTTWVRVDIKATHKPAALFDDFTVDLHSPAGFSAPEQLAELVRALQEWIPDYRRRHLVDGMPPIVRIGGVESGPPWRFNSTGSLFIYINTPPGAPRELALQEIRELLADVRRKRPEFDGQAELYSVSPGPSVAEGHALIGAVQAAHQSVFGQPPALGPVQFYSDASPLMAQGIPAVNYGPPGMIKHDPNGMPAGTGEFMRRRDVIEYARVCAAMILQVCG